MTLTEKYIILESHRNRASTTEFWDNGIIFIKLDDNSEVNTNDAKEHHAFLKTKFDGTNKLRVLTESGRFTTITKEAREFSTQPHINSMTLASAVIIKSLAHRIVINFIIGFTRQQNMKMRMFENKDLAIEWLLSIKQ
ncbi:MAG: STAS/SEC14 domain-containing protein [Bacteroidia bacterium]